MSADIEDQIRRFIVENFLFGNGDGLDRNGSLMGEGIMDSIGILDLVSFVEAAFRIDVAAGDILPEHFDSIGSLVAYVDSKLGNA